MKREIIFFTACFSLNPLVAFSAKASPSFAIGVKDTNRHKSTATAITVGKATAIDAMTQEASGAPAAGGVTSGSASNAAANDDAKKSAPAPEKLWIVGRLMEGLDERLGAKQEKIREFFVNIMYTVPSFHNDAAAVSCLSTSAIQRGSLSL